MLLLLFSFLIQAVISELTPVPNRCNDKTWSPGISSTTFESNITDDGPLMWTMMPTESKLGGWEDSEGHKDISQFDRYLVLSTPPSLNLSNVTDFYGCAMVYPNISLLLQVNENFTDYKNFSCDTVLSSTCQREMKQQALETLNGLFDQDPMRFSCFGLQYNLSMQLIPPSCNLGTRNWPLTEGGGIAGNIDYWNTVESPNQICSVDNSTVHNDLWAGIAGIHASRKSEEAKRFQTGTLPIMSLFFSPEQWNATLLPEPELHLSCLKPILTAKEEAKINGGVSVGDMLPHSYFAVVVLLTCAVLLV